jgi:ribonuclease BN (tRNA processing enzyme)
METRLVLFPLGSGGWIPANGLETSCFAFLWGDELVILDAGTGLARLTTLKNSLFKAAWPGIARVRIFLTHYHLDHCIGLFWLRGIFGDMPITIYAPGDAVYGKSAYDLLNELFQKPYSPYRLIELNPGIAVQDIGPDGFDLDGGPVKVHVGARINPYHTDPSIALRFGDFFAYVTDTPPEDEIVGFVRGVDVLLQESYFDSSPEFTDESDPLDRHTDGRHTGSFGAGLIAKRAGVSRVYFIHHNPERRLIEADMDARRVSGALGLDCRPALDLHEIRIRIAR